MKDIALYSKDQMGELIKSLSPKELLSEVSRMSEEQLKTAVQFLLPSIDTVWKEKIEVIYICLEERSLLEAVGGALISSQALAFLNLVHERDPKHQWKLSPIFVGMSHETFMDVLIKCNETQYHTLQQEALTEAVQHHLTLLGHDLMKQDLDFHETIKQLRIEISNLESESFNTTTIHSILDRIETLRDAYHRLLEINNRGLGLAWNTDRDDIIDTLNSTKESLTKTLHKEIGQQRVDMNPASGIYALFDQHLNTVYGDADNASDIEALHNDEPALEAMTKFSIWYLKDYWSLGLLPKIKSEESLHLDPSAHSEKECLEHREQLLKEIRSNLAKIGLSTVANFKSSQIYTREMLEDFVRKHKKLIQ